MLCCFKPPKDDAAAAAGQQPGPHHHQQQHGLGITKQLSGGSSAAGGGSFRRPSSSGAGPAAAAAVPGEPSAHLSEVAAQQAPPGAVTPGWPPAHQPHSAHAGSSFSSGDGSGLAQHPLAAAAAGPPGAAGGVQPGASGGGGPQDGVLQLVALLQELLGLSTASPKQPLAKAVAMLVLRLPVDWAALHAVSASGAAAMQVGAALSPEAQRQRGASGSAAFGTSGGATPLGRQRLGGASGGHASGAAASTLGSGGPGGGPGVVQELGAGPLALLQGSGNSLELVCSSRQALAMYAANDAEAGRLPPDWQRLFADRDLRSFLAVPIIASGSASGSIIGVLSFGITGVSDWGAAWWMGSIQLLCGWAAGALPQHRATTRVAFLEALAGANDLASLGRLFVHRLGPAITDQPRLEVRLALVSSRMAHCLMFAPAGGERRPSGEHAPHAAGGGGGAGAGPGSQQQQQQQERRTSSDAGRSSELRGVAAAAAEPQQQQQQRQQQQQSRLPPTGRRPSDGSAAAVAHVLSGSPGVHSEPHSTPLRAASSGHAGSQAVVGSADGPHQRPHQQQGAALSSSSPLPSSSGGMGAASSSSFSAAAAGPNGFGVEQPLATFSLPTSNSVLLSALEWGEPMVVKDTVTYFGRAGGSGSSGGSGGSSAVVRDLFLPDRPPVRGTLVLLPLLHRCRPLGCVYLLAPWDVHAALGKGGLQELAGLLGAGVFRALTCNPGLQQQWYARVLSEGPMPAPPRAPAPAQQQQQQQQGVAAPAAAAPGPGSGSGTSGGSGGGGAAGHSGDACGRATSPGPPGGGGGEPLGWSGEGAGVLLGSTEDSTVSDQLALSRPPSGSSAAQPAAAAAAAAVAAEQLLAGAPAAAAAATPGSSPPPQHQAQQQQHAAATTNEAAAACPPAVPVGLPLCGHAAPPFASLALWPELLDIKADLARSRHTAVYTAELGGTTLAVKLFRYATGTLDTGGAGGAPAAAAAGGAAGGPGPSIAALLGHGVGTSSSSSGNVAAEAELEGVLSLQYRLVSLSHDHVLRVAAVYPRLYEVATRRSSREPPDVHLAACAPRKERHHRCAVLVTEYAAGGCLRDAVGRGAAHVPTPAALREAAAAVGLPRTAAADLAALSSEQLAAVLAQAEAAGPLLQQQPLRQAPRSSLESTSGGQPAASSSGGGAAASGAAAAVAALLSPPRPSLDLLASREPCMPLLRQLLLHIASGMHALHAAGVLHGELRLDNVMVSGCLPPATALALQQQAAVAAAAAAGRGGGGSSPPPQHDPSAHDATAAAAADAASSPAPLDSGSSLAGLGSSPLASREGSSLVAGALLASREASVSGGSAAGAAGAAAAASASSTSSSAPSTPPPFVLKLKDVGLCNLAYVNRQVTLRKLAGRLRLQAVCWLAPECFRGEPLSKHSDVYAFGILMWELYTGQVAFNDLVAGNAKVLQTVIGDGVRPQFPAGTPAWYADLAGRCWAASPRARPSFRRIAAALAGLDDAAAAAATGGAGGGAGGAGGATGGSPGHHHVQQQQQ